MNYQVVFWDIDGTIFHGEDPDGGFPAGCPSLQAVGHAAAHRAELTLRMFGHQPPVNLAQTLLELETDLRARCGNRYSLEILARQLYRQLGVAERAEESLLLADALWGPRYRPWLFDGCAEALARLRQAGVSMGVITNNTATARMMRTGLQAVGLGDFFGPVICSCDVGARKPEPRIFNAALAALPPVTVADGRILYVGDNPEADIEGATACGWDAALHLTRPTAAPPAGSAVLTFTDYHELVRLVLN